MNLGQATAEILAGQRAFQEGLEAGRRERRLREEVAALRRIATAASEFLDAEWECAFTEAAAAKHHALSDAVEKWEEFEAMEGPESP